MKSSVFLAVAGGVLATATPVGLFKRKMVTDFVYEFVTVTVTAGDSTPTSSTVVTPAAHFAAGKHHRPAPTSTSTSTTTTTSIPPPPPPPPATTEEVIPVATTTQVVVVDETQPAAVIVTVEAEPTTSVEVQPTQAAAVIVTVQAQSEEPAPVQQATSTQQAVAQPTDYSSTAVYHHNVHRLNHSVPALAYSDTHADYARQTAEKCVFAHDLTPGGGGYGQNIAAFGTTGDMSMNAAMAQAASNGWYNDELYKFPSNAYGQANPGGDFEAYGHYTQLVWKGTQQVGCHTAHCAAGTIFSMASWYTVCNYYPAGNMDGAYGDNVFPPLGEATVQA